MCRDFLIWLICIYIILHIYIYIFWKICAANISEGQSLGFLAERADGMTCEGAIATLGMRAKEAGGWPRRNLAFLVDKILQPKVFFMTSKNESSQSVNHFGEQNHPRDHLK